MKSIATHVLLALLLMILLPNCQSLANLLRTVVVENSGGVVRTPYLNSTGQTAFHAQFGAGPEGLYKETGSGLSLVAGIGSGAPGVSGATFSFVGDAQFNDAGHTAFNGTITGESVDTGNSIGDWSEGDDGTLSLIARKRNPAPGVEEDVYFLGIGRPVLNGDGQIGFSGTLGGLGITLDNQRGVWSEAGGSGLALIARGEDPAPGTGSGVVFKSFGAPSLSDNGQTAFFGRLAGTGVSNSNDDGIWIAGRGAGLELAALSGGSAPDVPGGGTFTSVGGPLFNKSGELAFVGTISGAEVSATNSQGIWSEAGGEGLELVVRTGQQAPGTPGGANFAFLGLPSMSDGGGTVFLGAATGPGITDDNNSGIWSEQGGVVSLVAREGDWPPGTSFGAQFATFNFPVLNSNGQAAFVSSLTGDGVDESNDRGLWAEDPCGNLNLIAREGDTIDVDNGPGQDLRTINVVGFHASNSQGRYTFNDEGQIAFGASFTDGSSGAFVMELTAAPSDSADFDGDSDVDGEDFLLWQRGGSPCGAGHDDLAAWQVQYGTDNGQSPLAAVPEPTTLLLGLLGFLTAAGIFKSRKNSFD